MQSGPNNRTYTQIRELYSVKDSREEIMGLVRKVEND